MITCTWQTVADWATELTLPAATFNAHVTQAGPYVRVCEDGTVWMNETLALAIAAAQP